MEAGGFKAVKVSVKQGTRSDEKVSQSMMYSGVNIFGHLTRQYMERKNAPETIDMQDYTGGEKGASIMSSM